MPRILCLGMSALDAIYRVSAIPTTPTKILATGFTESGGGMAANASVAVARLGGHASYWGRVGADALGTRILGQLADEGVDVSGVRRIAGCVSPSAAILVDDVGERLICAYNDPKLDHDASWLPLARIPDFDAVLVDVRWPAGAALVLDAATVAGIPAVFDGDIGPRAALLDLARRATHVVFSEPGLAQATGVDSPGEGLARIAGAVSGVVGVTLGPEGFLWREGGQERRIPSPVIVPVDTLGLATSGTAPLRWRWRSGAISATRRGLQMSLPPSNAPGREAGWVRRVAPKFSRCFREIRTIYTI